MRDDSKRDGPGVPTSAAIQARARKFPCPQCGADVVWNPSTRKLRCDYCSFEQAVAGNAVAGVVAASGGPAGPALPQIAERALDFGLAQKADLGWGAERKAVRCTKCGAVETFEPGVAAKACAFCGTPAVVEAPTDSNLVRPEGVLPFTVAKNDALQRFRGWLSALWFRPSNLKERAALTGIHGIYVPFWTFDAGSRSDWTAEAGFKRGSGKNARIEWRPASGTLDHSFDDLPVPASQGIDAATAREIEPFPTAQFVAYDPSYLSGFLAEEYAVGLGDAQNLARQRMDETLRQACRAEVPGDECRNLRVSTVYSDWQYKSGLVPVWIAAYVYQGKSFRYVVNGATGKAAGTAPWSWVKIAFAVLAGLIVFGFILSNS
ncbi:MAG: zinc ribbon domain-containing protein [Thermoanaerobaculia bacterium]